MLNTDVLYQIMLVSDINTILSICLTSKYNFDNKLFWLLKFKNLPLPIIWQKKIYKNNNSFVFISYYKLFLNIEPYDYYIRSFKVLKNKIGNIIFNVKLANKQYLKYILYRVFNINNIDVKYLTSIKFYYHGYVWTFFYYFNHNCYDVNIFNVVDIEQKMILFLYKLLKYKLHFKLDVLN